MSNPLIQRYKTYGELITELRTRLGFVSQGPSANNNKSILDSFLQEAHEAVYAQLQPEAARKKTRIKLEAGSYLYDYHNDEEDENIDPGSVISMWIVDSGENRYKLRQGISERMREDDDRSQPLRYDTLDGQIELHPIPDEGPYDLLIEYIQERPRFTRDNDRPGVPDRLVFLFALYMAQAHYRMPDHQVTLQLFQSMMTKEKAKQHENRRYFISHPTERKGYVVRSGDKFVYRED